MVAGYGNYYKYCHNQRSSNMGPLAKLTILWLKTPEDSQNSLQQVVQLAGPDMKNILFFEVWTSEKARG